jgi:ketosteroid isomerase-like protein
MNATTLALTVAVCAAPALAATTPAAAPKPAAAAPASPAAATPAAHPAGPSDKAQIEALEKRFIAAFNAKDVKAIMANYAPGEGLFVFDVTPPREYVGWDAYKKDWEDLFKAFPGPAKAEIADLAVTTSGAMAYAHSIQSVSFTAADGSKSPVTARVTDVYRKLNGRWKIVHEHVSVPVDLATAKADLSSKP